MGDENVKIESVALFDLETGKKIMDLVPCKTTPELQETVTVEETVTFEEDLTNDFCEFCRAKLKEEIDGSRVQAIDDDLHLVYLDKANNPIASTAVMPDIINVSNPNKETVFVEFSDGTKEVAHLNEGDVFSLETGILICITKKLLADMDIMTTGSSAYNKIIKYAMTKVDATKKAREALLKKRKEENMKIASIKQEARRAENKKREERIREMSEAYKRAINDVSNQASKELEETFKGFIDDLEKNIEKDE